MKRVASGKGKAELVPSDQGDAGGQEAMETGWVLGTLRTSLRCTPVALV